MTTSPARRVLIVGGGIAGGVAALALRQRGVEVVVVEQRREMGGVGHGITLQGNALKAFHSVGVFERIAERGFPFGHLRMRSADGATSSPRSRHPPWAAARSPRRWAHCAGTWPTSSPRRS